MPGATVKGACGFLRTGSLSRAVRVSSLVERGRRAMIYLRCLGSVQAMGVEAVGTLWKMIERFSVSSRSCHKRLEGSGIAWKGRKPYKGGAPAAAALAAGDIPLGVLASSSVAPHVKSGRVRVLAVTMGKRSTLNPEWPTLQQEGVKEVDASNWTALFAPKATPQPVIDKLNAEVVKILHMPDVKERFAGGGVDTIPSSAAELDARVKQEAERFRAIVQKANIRPG